MKVTLVLAGLGYLTGSLMFAELFGWILMGKSIAAESEDKNPGTYNAFKYGGMLCGCLTLLGDLLKGFLPVYLYSHLVSEPGIGLAMVMAAPVLGHLHPVFHSLKGGKGIAVSFGCLIGLIPQWIPLASLVVLYLFFSLAFKITSHTIRTIATYLLLGVSMLLMMHLVEGPVILGVCLISGMITVKHIRCAEYKRKRDKEIVWKH